VDRRDLMERRDEKGVEYENVVVNPSNLEGILYERLREELDTGWPWPLDSVQNFFEELWNKIVGIPYKIIDLFEDSITDLVRALYDKVIAPYIPMIKEVVDTAYSYLENVPEFARPLLLPFVLPTAFFEIFVLPKLEDIASKIWDIMPNWLKGAINAIYSFVDDVAEGIRAFVSDPVKFLSHVIGNIHQKINRAVDDLKEHVQAVFDGATNVIANALHSIFDPFTEKITGFFESIIEGIKSIPDKAKEWIEAIKEGLANVGETVKGALGEFWSGLTDFFTDKLAPAVAGALSKAGTWLNEKVIKPVWEDLQWLRDWITDYVVNIFHSIVNKVKEVSSKIMAGDISAALGLLSTFTGMGLAVNSIISVAGLKVMGTGLEVGELSRFLNRLLDPGLVTGMIIGTVLSVGVQEPVRQVFSKMFRTRLPSESDIERWYLRGYITEDHARELLARYGYKDEYVDNKIKSYWVIPSISDLINFVVKEVITPDDFYSWAKKQGLSEYWAKNYWEAHWRLPSFENLREAYWRGIISADEFKKFVIWHDYKPEPRPGISKSDQQIMFELSYKLPGKIDARWMYRWGIITKEELRNLVKMEGTHPDWIDKVVEGEVLNMMLDERTRLLSTLRQKYRDGMLSRDSFQSRIKELRFTEEEMNLIIQQADEEADMYNKRDLLDYYKELFRRRQITKTKFVEDLVAQGFSEDKIRRLADVLELKYGLEFQDLTKDERSSIRSRLKMLYKEGLIDEDTLRTRLKDLGFSDDEIELTIEDADLYYKYDFAMDFKNVIIEAFRRDKIDYNTALRMLTVDMKQIVGLAMREERAKTLLDKELVKKKLEAS